MSLLRLADHAVFDDTDEAGIILDTREGVYLTLNATATLMLQAALQFDTLDKVIGRLQEQIDATEAILTMGLNKLTAQLNEHALLAPRQEEPQ
jgi:hypothetical protein